MSGYDPEKAGLHMLQKLAALVIIVAGIRAASDIIVPLLLAVFFAIVLNPLVAWFMRRGLQRGLAVTVVVITMLILMSLVIGVLASSLNEFSTRLPAINHMLTERALQLERLIPGNQHLAPERLLQHMDSERMVSFATALMTRLSGAMISVVVLVMTVIFMLMEVRHIPYKLRFALNNPRIHIASLHRALKGVSHYLALKTLMSLLTGVITWVGLKLLGVEFALMWSVLAFLLNFIPNIGATLSAIPPMLQAMLFNGWYECLMVGALFSAIHMVIGNMVEPRVMGRRLGMSTLVVFLSLLFWGWLLGPVGMLLSVPLTSVCKIWMETTKGGSKLAILLGPGRPKPRPLP